MSDDDFINSETNRKSYNMMRYGNIHSINSSNDKAKVSFDNGQIITDFLPWLAGASGDVRIYRVPTVGEQVLLISPAGEMNMGVILCGIFTDDYPAPVSDANVHKIQYVDGGYFEYNFQTGDMNVHATGNINIISAGSVSITAPNDVNIQGNLHVSGDVTAGGVSLRHHIHTGDSGGVTSEPIA